MDDRELQNSGTEAQGALKKARVLERGEWKSHWRQGLHSRLPGVLGRNGEAGGKGPRVG